MNTLSVRRFFLNFLQNFYLVLQFAGGLIIVSQIKLSYGQKPQLPPEILDKIINKIEEISERYEETPDYTDILDDLYYFIENPLNLNYASYEELNKLFFLDELQIHKIIEYRNVYGNFLSLYELLAIEGFNKEILEILEPFVTVSAEKPPTSFRPGDIWKYSRNDLFLRYGRILQKQAGYSKVSDSVKYVFPSRYYLGNPDRYFLRYGLNYQNQIRLGIVAEKDPGEQFFKGSQKQGFDFYSGYIFYGGNGVLHQLILGDYQLEFAQGLTMWTGFTFGKSSDVITVRKRARNLRPSTTSNESRFLRGSAITLKFSDLQVTGFYSSKKIDANPEYADSLFSVLQYVTSLDESGYHRTPSELEKKNVNTETIFGGRIHYQTGKFQAGTTFFRTFYRVPIIPIERTYNSFFFRGDENTNYGFDLSFITGRFYFFSEFSASQNGGKAFIGGFQSSLHPIISLSAIYRNYGIRYQNLYSNAFGENTSNQNERGMYIGVLLEPLKNLSLRAMADLYHAPWLQYRVDFPSYGKEYLIQTEYRPTRRLEIHLRFRQKQDQINAPDQSYLARKSEIVRTNCRFSVIYQVTEQLLLKNRIEFLIRRQADQSVQNGFLVYQDINWQTPLNPLSITLRYALFHTDSYDERIYAWENDLLYVFSVPAYYYQGSRSYFLIRYRFNDHVDFWLKYAQTFYADRTIIGSGPSQIEGRTRSEIKAQLRIHW